MFVNLQRLIISSLDDSGFISNLSFFVLIEERRELYACLHFVTCICGCQTMIRNDNLYLILSLMHGWSNSTQRQVKPYTVRVLEAIIEFVQIWYLFWQPDKIFSVSILNGIVWRAQDDTWPIYFSSFWRFACTRLGMCTNRKLSGIRRTVPHVRSYYTCTIVHV